VSARSATPRPPRLELTVPGSAAGTRLDAHLGGSPEIGTRAGAQALIAAERVSVDGRVRPKSHRLAGGERIEVDLGEPVEGARPAPDTGRVPAVPYALVYEDDDLLVVDKPAGVVVHPGHGREHGTLAQALAGRTVGGPPERRGVVHRLDRDTSGLLLFAGSQRAYDALVEALRRRAVRREYLALVEGVPDAPSGTVDAAVGRGRSDRTRISIATDRPRSARTRFSVREALARTALLELELETGRTHQIRAHAAAIGHPVCGDARYAGGHCGRRLGLERQFLHAARLSLAHPITGDPLSFESPLPDDLDAALGRARSERAGA